MAGGGLPSAAQQGPTNIGISADSSFFLQDMTWDWSATGAIGTGTAVVNLCQPICADGHDIEFPVQVELTEPQHLCGKDFFTKMVTTSLGDPPPDVGPNSTNDLTPFCG